MQRPVSALVSRLQRSEAVDGGATRTPLEEERQKEVLVCATARAARLAARMERSEGKRDAAPEVNPSHSKKTERSQRLQGSASEGGAVEDVYKGGRNAAGEPHGWGRYEWNSDTFTDVDGIERSAKGMVYEGEWQNGLQHGKG